VADAYTIHWSGPALEDLRGIRAWVARDRPDAARRLATEILNRVEALASFPASGRVVPEIGIEAYREIVVRPYRVIYRVRETDVVILRVWHARRDLPDDAE
jgi:toxin ParE1/3/4